MSEQPRRQHVGKKEPVLVLGAGIIGLCTGLTLLEEGHPTTIWAAELPPNTTSNKAGGLIQPYKCDPPDRVNSWTAHTFQHYESRYFGCPKMNALGLVHRQKTYEYFTEPKLDPEWKSIMPSFRRLKTEELLPGYTDGWVVDAMVLEVPRLLPYLLDKFRELGGIVVRKEVKDIQETFQHYDLVCNCTGLGSYHLLNDTEMFPLRGQILRIAQVGIDKSMADEEGPLALSYIISRKEDVILGGTAYKGDWSTEPNEKDTQEILRKCPQLCSSLGKGKVKILEVVVGLRPGRTQVRLEEEAFTSRFDGKKKYVIHNYGHGGSGFTVSWGCAKETVELIAKAQSELRRLQSSSSLPNSPHSSRL